MEESSSPTLFPWLLYSHGKDYRNKTLCNIAWSTHQPCSIPHLNKKSILASSHGWFILESQTYGRRRRRQGGQLPPPHLYSLWNPITLQSIEFPPLNLNPTHQINSCILSSSPPPIPRGGGNDDDDDDDDDDPNSNSDSMLLLFETTVPAIFVCRLFNSPSEWIELRYGNEVNGDDDHLHTPVSYNGQVFARGKSGELFRVEINHDNTIFLQQLPDLPPLPAPHSYFWLENLVECCGELYTVYRTEDCSVGDDHDDGPNRLKEIVSVNVFKLNFSEMIWEKVDNIKDHAFFLSKNGSTSCPAPSLSSFPAHKNRIFFTMDEDRDKNLYSYHLEDGTLTMSRPCPDLPPPRSSPIWVTMPTKALVFAEERKDDEEKTVFPWTNLPMDLQTLIAEKLPLFDYMNFRALCRMNRLIAPPIQLRNKLSGPNQSDWLHLLSPWLVFSPSGKNVCNLLHPSLNGRYLVKTPELFQDPIVRFCRGSWLLMSSSVYSEFSWAMFLFNPFTKDTIQLPSLPVEPDPAVCFSFSSLPYSEDPCYIVCYILHPFHKVTFLVTYPDAKKWTLLEFSNDTDFRPTDNAPVFTGRSFYYLGEEDKVGALTIREEGWRWHVWYAYDMWEMWNVWGVPNVWADSDEGMRPDDFQQNYFVEWDGALLSVSVGHSGKWVKLFWLSNDPNNALVFWQPVIDLGKHVLYLSRLSTFSKVVEEEGTGNRIYFDRLYKERGVYYSLSTRKFHTTDGKEWLKSYNNTSEPLLSAWIEPPCWK